MRTFLTAALGAVLYVPLTLAQTAPAPSPTWPRSRKMQSPASAAESTASGMRTCR